MLVLVLHTYCILFSWLNLQHQLNWSFDYRERPQILKVFISLTYQKTVFGQTMNFRYISSRILQHCVTTAEACQMKTKPSKVKLSPYCHSLQNIFKHLQIFSSVESVKFYHQCQLLMTHQQTISFLRKSTKIKKKICFYFNIIKSPFVMKNQKLQKLSFARVLYWSNITTWAFLRTLHLTMMFLIFVMVCRECVFPKEKNTNFDFEYIPTMGWVNVEVAKVALWTRHVGFVYHLLNLPLLSLDRSAKFQLFS